MDLFKTGLGLNAAQTLLINGGDTLQQSPDALVGQMIDDKYKIVAHLASGGTASVFKATRVDQEFEKDVAVKILHDEKLVDSRVSQFNNEKQLMATLRHDNILSIIDSGVLAERYPYLIMDYLDGRTLLAYIKEEQPSAAQINQWIKALLDAVGFLHDNQIIHRDIKPANIFIDASSTLSYRPCVV